MHIHIRSGEGEAKFWIEPAVSMNQNFGFSSRELKRLERIIKEHRDEIIAAWKKHFKS